MTVQAPVQAPVQVPLSDDELLARFEAATLTPDVFDHREHVRLAWLHVTRMPLLEAIRIQCAGLQRLTAALGVPKKFHATITVAWVLLVHDRVAAGAGASWPAFREANPDLLERGAAVLGRHYSAATLGSNEARGAFVPPDLDVTSMSRSGPMV